MDVIIKNLLQPHIVKDIRNIIIEYIFMKCGICNNMYETLIYCYCNKNICNICMKPCISCNINICVNCEICDDCNTIYENTLFYID